MTLLNKDDPLMRKVMPFFDFENPPIDPIKLKEELIDRMFEEGGVGLAANQIGYEYRAFVMKGANKEQSMFLVNPEIIKFSDETVVMEEGCLTGGCEGIFANTSRITFYYPTGAHAQTRSHVAGKQVRGTFTYLASA